jgi:hypothetical protein
MGVKYNREYKQISEELAAAIATIDDCYEFFEMERSDWLHLAKNERMDCIRTLSDDLFYALGADPVVNVGSGVVEYDARQHLIKVTAAAKIVHVIKLI